MVHLHGPVPTVLSRVPSSLPSTSWDNFSQESPLQTLALPVCPHPRTDYLLGAQSTILYWVSRLSWLSAPCRIPPLFQQLEVGVEKEDMEGRED